MDPFLGSEVLAAGTITRYQLTTRFRSVHRNVYVLKDQELDPVQKAKAAYLWPEPRSISAAGRV